MTASEAGQHLSVTGAAAQQHFAKLAEASLVEPDDVRHGRGRPRRFWRLTDKGHARFPDRHAELTLGMIDGVRAVFGDEGLDQLVQHRETKMRQIYAARTADRKTLAERVDALAQVRDEEGYMARVEADEGGFLLIEDHCPICAAAAICQGFCRSELTLFQETLGPDATVERVEYLLGGARRCAYRIIPKS